MAGKPTAAEVGVKLVIDDNAKAAAANIVSGLKSISSKVAGAGSKLSEGFEKSAGLQMLAGSLATGFAAVAGAAVLAGGAAYEFGEKSVHAYMESAARAKELAGTLTLIDQKGNAFEKLRDYAKDLNEEFEDLGIKLGETADTVAAVFNDVIDRGGKSVDAAKALTDEIILAGRALPGGAESISQGFEMIETGMVRARNPVVQMISATGTLKGSAKAVAKQMQAMTIDKQMELAEKAIGKMSKKMEGVPLTMGQMKKSMEGEFEKIFEAAGAPITKALGPIYGKIRSLFLDSGGALEAGARQFGEIVASALGLVVPIMDAVSKVIKDNWGDIKAVVDSIAGSMKETTDYMARNQDAIGKTFADITKDALSLFKTVGEYFVHVVKFTLGPIMDAAKWLINKGTGGKMNAFMADEATTSQTLKMRASVGAMPAMAAGDEHSQAVIDLKNQMAKELVDAGLNEEEAQKRASDAWKRAADDHNAAIADVAKYRQAAVAGDTMSFVKAWQAAETDQDEGAKEYVANFLAANKELVKAIGEKGPEILGEGFGDLVKKLQSMHSTVADDLKKGAQPNLGVTGKNVTQNFNGGIHIKQDFRDQDPDRVVTIMRDELVRAGTTRIQATNTSPYGF